MIDIWSCDQFGDAPILHTLNGVSQAVGVVTMYSLGWLGGMDRPTLLQPRYTD